MENINILKLSLYQIQMFLSVAKSENITASAHSLHLSQSMLSKNISSIERELGLILFLRERGRLKLTPAGKIMQRELEVACEIIEQAIAKAAAQQAVEARPLRIGFPDSSSQEKYLLPSIADFKRAVGQFKYNLEFYQFKDLPIEIQRGNLDVIFTTLFEKDSIEGTGMDYAVIARYPLTIHVTPANPLAKKEVVTVENLAMMRLVMPSPRVVPSYYQNVILHIFKDAAVVPKVSYYASSSDAVAANIVNDDEVFISDSNRKVEPFYDLIRIPIANTESGIILAWRAGAHPLVDAFAKNTVTYWTIHGSE